MDFYKTLRNQSKDNYYTNFISYFDAPYGHRQFFTGLIQCEDSYLNTLNLKIPIVW